eukprot:TRINITY_DN8828_c0_g1_i1.p1 TRINITY_DN8828_c0_g1~~TRINITY_DN8828_c0_g1_i1.p1  ORF type:complete len:226 (-),score=30.67 TRINITY_DN8828_c0_g1_i1:131-808(-)
MPSRIPGLEEAVHQARNEHKDMSAAQLEQILSSRGFNTSSSTISRILRSSAATAKFAEATAVAVGQPVRDAEGGPPKRRRVEKAPQSTVSDVIQSMDKFALGSSVEIAVGSHETAEQLTCNPTTNVTSECDSPKKNTLPPSGRDEPGPRCTTTPTRTRPCVKQTSRATTGAVIEFKSPSSAEKLSPPVRERRDGFLGALDSLESLAFVHQQKATSAAISFEVDRL